MCCPLQTYFSWSHLKVASCSVVLDQHRHTFFGGHKSPFSSSYTLGTVLLPVGINPLNLHPSSRIQVLVLALFIGEEMITEGLHNSFKFTQQEDLRKLRLWRLRP